MGDIATEERWISTPDNHKLYFKQWNTASTPKARMLFIHGFSDHCNAYDILFPKLASKGIKVYSFDQRGWGRTVQSPKQRGLTGPTEQVLADIATVMRALPGGETDIPLFLMGHSMGGGEVLHYAASGPKDTLSGIRGFLLESPLIGLTPEAQPWRSTVFFGRLAGRLMPHAQMERKLDPADLCRDPEVCKAWDADTLCHDTGTLEGLAGLVQRTEDLENGRTVLREGIGEGGKTRLWIGHGTMDKVTSFPASRKLFDALGVEDKELKAYEGWYHKLHAEPGEDKVTFANDVAKWVLDRSGPLSTGGRTPSKI